MPTLDPDGNETSYYRDFGDGITSYEASPTHTYAKAGTNTVTLTCTGCHNAITMFTKTLQGGKVGASESSGLGGSTTVIAAVVVVLIVIGAVILVRRRQQLKAPEPIGVGPMRVLRTKAVRRYQSRVVPRTSG